MAVQVKGISLVQGSRDFNVKGVQITLAGPTPNNTLPLVDPASGGTVQLINAGLVRGQVQ